MAQDKTAFNATERTAKLIPPVITIDGKDYLVKRTGKALKAIIGLNPESEDENDPNENIDLLYKGLSLLIIDPSTKEHPDAEELSDVLDFQVAQELMETLVPRAEGNEEVVSETAPSMST